MPRKKRVAKKAPVKRTRRAKLFVDGPKASPNQPLIIHDGLLRKEALVHALALTSLNGEELVTHARKIYEFLAGADYPPLPQWLPGSDLPEQMRTEYVPSVLEGLMKQQNVTSGYLGPVGEPIPNFETTVYPAKTGDEPKAKSKFDAHTL